MIDSVLCVDVGNTAAKLALVNPDRVEPVGVISTRELSDAPSVLGRLLTREEISHQGIAGVALSSVVPPLDQPLSRILRETVGTGVCQIDHASRLPFRLRVDDPAKLGSDRICAAAGAMGRRGAGAIVVDVGSAVTVDLLHQKAFCGGVILVGPGLGLQALGQYASRLPKIDQASITEPFPREFSDTEPSMILGANLGAVGAIKEAVRLLQKTVGGRARVYVTGGMAEKLAKRLPRSWRLEPNLVFIGLFRVWHLNAVSM